MNGYSTITELRAISYLRKNKIPFVLYINGGIIKKDNYFKKKYKTKIISSAWKYLSPSEAANKYLEYYGANKKDILLYPYSTYFDKEIVKNPLNPEQKAEIRKKYNLPNGKLIVTACQYIERKNNEQLLKIFKDLSVNLLLIGSGPLKEKYEDYIKNNNMTNVIIMDFLQRNELFEVLRSCDCFITLSKQDIYGHTTAEALANGLPVISSDKVVSSLKLIKNNFNGFVVSLDNDSEIVDAISRVSNEMSEHAIEVAKENTVEKMAEAHKNIFLELEHENNLHNNRN
jgi:glycosyltransferase involved in cell wall biosynthesis